MTSENEYTDVDGVRYVAKMNTGCNGCAAENPGRMLCRELPPCTPKRRKDGRSVIWVKAEDGSRA